jgi:hypothetical protein
MLMLLFHAVLIPVPRSDGHLLSSDAGYYYAYMRSLLLDRDLDIRNDIEFYNSRLPAGHSARLGEAYVFSVGPGLLWSPFFIMGHTVVRLANASGMQIASDGFSIVEEALVSLASIAYVVIGLLLLFQTVTRLARESIAAFAVLGTFLASPAVYYTLFEPTMSHTLELFSVALFFWALLGRSIERPRDALLLGGASALVFLVRWQNAVFLVLVPLVLAIRWRDREGWPDFVPGITAFLLGALPVALIQPLFWRIALGSYVVVPQGSGFLNPLQPHLLDVLFSTRHGLFSWTPALMLGLIGLAWMPSRPLAIGLFVVFLLDLYVCSIATDWWAGEAFGMRRMIGATPVFALGMAAGLSAARSRVRRVVAGVIAILVLWNAAFMLQYRLELIPKSEALTFSQMTTDKFLLPAKLVGRFVR